MRPAGRRFCFLLLLLLTLSTAPAEGQFDFSLPAAQPAAPSPAPDLWADDGLSGYMPNSQAESWAAKAFRSASVRAGALIVTRYGEPLAVYVTGDRDTHDNPVTLHTRFRIASVTKMVTAIGLMRLYDQQRFALDDPIGDYLPMKVLNPACPDEPITFRQVLSHTSTVKQTSSYRPDWENLPVSNKYFYKNLTPGQKYHYANLNGGLCGALIEALSGQSINAFMTQSLFHPLGIDAAYSPNLLIDQEDISALMTKSGKVTSNPSRILKLAQDYDDTCDPALHTDRTAGSLYISPAGLNKLMVMMVSGGEYRGVRVLEESTVRLMEADQSLIPGSSVRGKSDYGLFVTHFNLNGHTWYGHQGRFNGLTSDAFYQPDTGLTLVLVVNGYGGKSNDSLANLARSCLNWADETFGEDAGNGL